MRSLFILISFLLSTQGFAQQTPPQSSTTINTSGGTSTTTMGESVPSQKSPFGFVAISAVEVAADDFRDRNSSAALSTTNAIGLTYKPNQDVKLGIRQYATYSIDGDKGNKFERASTVLTYSQKLSGIWGSDDIVPVIWYYLPTTERAISERSNGKLRATAYVSWTLNPKWSFTYLFDPRQSFTPSSFKSDGSEVFSHTTWVHGGSFSYNLSDTFSIYHGIGTSEDFKSSSLTLLDESVDISTGMYITLGKVLLIPDISNSIPTRKNAERPAARKVSSTLYRAEETTYSISMLANF